jgi:hypothetical protein
MGGIATARAVGASGLMTAMVVSLLALAPSATARQVESGEFQDSFSMEVEDFCDQPGLTVSETLTFEGRYRITARKPGTVPYYMERVRFSQTDVNADGDSVTAVFGVTDKDLKITENGDGTATVLVLETGSSSLYDDATGKAIARNPGQVRFELLVDLSGTEEDQFLGSVKESTGRTDDYCAAALEVLG